jgi:cyclopropane-fatty-acyl-phospholipid synthase
MRLSSLAGHIGESIAWPDPLLRAVIGQLVARTDRRLSSAPPDATDLFAKEMQDGPIALHTGDANAQHYELPERFFSFFLGPRRKYSSCLFPDTRTTLADAEEFALAQTAEHAGLADGQTILELGCGWGSLSLWMAERFRNARVTAVSNSRSQRAYILGEAEKRGLSNLTVLTADMNEFSIEKKFDRVVSVEMFEHMSNWRTLLSRIKRWLAHDGRAFIHVFTHARAPYRFDHDNPGDWIAQHFFTGGLMPSHRLMHEFQESFAIEQEWRWSGEHYSRTADAWLANYDANTDQVREVLEQVYGRDASLWNRRWRMFFMATSGLFGHASGSAWGVSHYRLVTASA